MNAGHGPSLQPGPLGHVFLDKAMAPSHLRSGLAHIHELSHVTIEVEPQGCLVW